MTFTFEPLALAPRWWVSPAVMRVDVQVPLASLGSFTLTLPALIGPVAFTLFLPVSRVSVTLPPTFDRPAPPRRGRHGGGVLARLQSARARQRGAVQPVRPEASGVAAG